MSGTDFHRIVGQAEGMAALGRLDPIQLPSDGTLQPDERLRVQRLVNTTYAFIQQLASVTGDIPEVCTAVTIGVAVAVASKCPPEMREQFVEALCENLKAHSLRTTVIAKETDE